MNNRSKITITVVVVVTLFFIWIISGTQSKEVPFLSIEELVTGEYDQDRFRLGGNVQAGSIQIAEDDLLKVEFILEQGESIIKVHYYKIRPDLFADDCEVIVEGEYRNSEFYADNLMTKCASRYEGDLRDNNSYNLDEI